MADNSYNKFRAWLRFGPVGSRFVYYTGLLAADRERVYISEGAFVSKVIEPVNTIGKTAMALASKGALTLTQRKLGKGHYEYLAQKQREIRI